MGVFAWSPGCNCCGGVCEHCLAAISAVLLEWDYNCGPFDPTINVAHNISPWSSHSAMSGSIPASFPWPAAPPTVNDADFCQDVFFSDTDDCASFGVDWASWVRFTSTHMLITIYIGGPPLVTMSGSLAITGGNCAALSGSSVVCTDGTNSVTVTVTIS